MGKDSADSLKVSAGPLSIPDEPGEDRFIGRVLDGRYAIMEMVGKGGMATVYRGQHSLIERQVAIKLLSPKASGVSNIKKRFYREARVVNRIQHPNVLDVIDLGETEEGLLYLVMDFLEGESVFDRLALGPLEPLETVRILEQVCRGLGRAHDLGIIHRDLSPSNIFLCEEGAGRIAVRVLDFGIAFIKDETRLSMPGTVLGTPHYMAPEYAMGQDVVPGSDLYSLGAVGYEMLCGQPPFDAPDYSSVIVMHVKEEPEPLARRNPSVPRALSDAIMRCLAKKPEERFVNAYELQEELERIYRDLDGERRSKTPSAPEEVPLSGETPHVAPAAVGIDVIKSYVQNARSDATSEYPAPVDEQVAKLLSSLEKLDAAIATTERKVEEHRNRVQATRDRFARAYATLEAEHGRIVGEVNSVEADLAVTTSQRSNVEHKFLEMRRRVRRAELDTGLTGPGLAMVDEALASLYEETASAACRWKEAHAAEQDCKEKLEERRGELRDLKFQLGQLESNRDAAIAKLEGTARGLSMVLKEQQSERKGLYDVFVAKTGSFQS